MKVYLLKDVEKIGMTGEIIKVSDGYATNYLIPHKLAVIITPENEIFYKNKIKTVENRKEAIASASSMLAEKIKTLQLTIKRKTHDSDKLYGSIVASDIVDLLAEKGISVAKNQIIITKAIKSVGSYDVTIKLSTRLTPTFTLKVVQE